ncbi:MAG: GtrA family protein [Pseudomonadota bacterium]
MRNPVVPKSLYRYGLVGIASNALVYGVFLALIWSAVPPVWATGMCYGIGLIVSYLANRVWSFESTADHRSDLPRFLLAYGIGFVATLVFMSALVTFLRPELAQIVNIGLTAIAIYASLQALGFGRGKGPRGDHL